MRPAVPDMLRNTFHAIDMLFVWISSEQGISLVNLQTYFYEKMGLDARAVSSVYWLCQRVVATSL